MEIGCCIGLEYYDILARLGFDTITLSGTAVTSLTEKAFSQAVKKAQTGPLAIRSINAFCPAVLRLTGKGADPGCIRGYARLLLERSAALGARYVGIGAPKSRNVEPGSTKRAALDQLQNTLRILCEEGARLGMDILLEPVCGLECNLLTTTLEALDFLKQTRLPNLHLVYDIYHEMAEGQPLSVVSEAVSEIRVVHIAQNHGNLRCYLDKAHTDTYRAYWNAFIEAGYNGEFNLEAMHGDPDAGLPESYNILNWIRENESNESSQN